MDNKTRAKYEARAEICKALAHPTRLFIVDQLSEGECCVCELTEMVGYDISTVAFVTQTTATPSCGLHLCCFRWQRIPGCSRVITGCG